MTTGTALNVILPETIPTSHGELNFERIEETSLFGKYLNNKVNVSQAMMGRINNANNS